MRTAVGIVESSHIRVMRVADNMRNVAVTEGDKVEAQIKFGWEVDAYPVNEIAESVAAVSQSDTNALVDEYYDKYEILLEGRDPEEFKKHVAVQAQIELGFERFLQEKNYQAIVTHFGDLGALKQLPGLAIQRLMEKGYGFGAEGDWKVAAMVRLMKVMTAGMKDAKFNLANFMRVHLFTALGALKDGLDILLKEEGVQIDKMYGHGGLFKTPVVGQRIMAAAIDTPVSVMETAGEGGAWGIALLAAYMAQKEEGESLADYLNERVFGGQEGVTENPVPADVEGFDQFLKRYNEGLAIERAAVEHL